MRMCNPGGFPPIKLLILLQVSQYSGSNPSLSYVYMHEPSGWFNPWYIISNHRFYFLNGRLKALYIVKPTPYPTREVYNYIKVNTTVNFLLYMFRGPWNYLSPFYLSFIVLYVPCLKLQLEISQGFITLLLQGCHGSAHGRGWRTLLAMEPTDRSLILTMLWFIQIPQMGGSESRERITSTKLLVRC